jgi:hypothetical protein
MASEPSSSARGWLLRRKVPRVTQLSIPGTHGTWPRSVNANWEGWRRWYIAVTLRTRQVIIWGPAMSDNARETRIEYAVSCGGEVHEHHFGGQAATEDYDAAFDLLAAVAQRCKKGHHQVVSRVIEVGPWG